MERRSNLNSVTNFKYQPGITLVPFGKAIIHFLGDQVWMCSHVPAHAFGEERVGICACLSKLGGSEGGVKCYSFSSFHVTEKCLCQTLQRRERVFS